VDDKSSGTFQVEFVCLVCWTKELGEWGVKRFGDSLAPSYCNCQERVAFLVEKQREDDYDQNIVKNTDRM
jgi:hypothetical protein